MYFVAECMTMLAPSSSGRVSAGVAKVLSTPSKMPRLAASFAHAAISVIDSKRIAGAFDPQQFGLRRDRRFDGRQIARVYKRNLQPDRLGNFVEQPVRAAVNVAASRECGRRA